MKLLNTQDVETWLSEMNLDGKHLRRYQEIDLERFDMDHEAELIKHVDLWMQDKTHFTFHHIRNLFKCLKNESIKYPLVGTIHSGCVGIDPGGSRMMVAKTLGKNKAPLDLICDKDFVHETIEGHDFEIVSDIEKFCDAYKDVKCDIWLQTCREDAQLPFNKSDKWDGEFWYQPNYTDIWHFRFEDIESYNKSFHGKHQPNKMDYYFL